MPVKAKNYQCSSWKKRERENWKERKKKEKRRASAVSYARARKYQGVGNGSLCERHGAAQRQVANRIYMDTYECVWLPGPPKYPGSALPSLPSAAQCL